MKVDKTQLGLSESEKDVIIEKAKEVCMWLGWMELRQCPGAGKVKDLKETIERLTGLSLGEYT